MRNSTAKQQRLFFLILLALGGLQTFPSFATTFIPKSDSQKVLEAKFICAVDILDLKTERLESTVVTKAKAQPIECFKGKLSKPFYVKWPGGTYTQAGKTYHVAVPGTPNLRKGKPVILYLWRSSEKDDFTILSWVHGVIPLERTSSNELVIPKEASTPTNKAPKAESKSAASLNVKSAPSKSPNTKNSKAKYETLSSFRERIERILSSATPER